MVTPLTSPVLALPVWCLVSDRRRLAGASEGSARALVALVAAAARAGVQVIQVRERDLQAAELCALVRNCVAAVQGTGARILVNDRTDVALAAGADGVHLRHDGPQASRVRGLAPPGFLIGRSVHSVIDAKAAVADGAADYLIAGTVFQTPSKAAHQELLGLDGLRAVVAAADVPVLAIGGMTASVAIDVANTGAAGIAAIGMFCHRPVSASAIRQTIEIVRAAFDTCGRVPYH